MFIKHDRHGRHRKGYLTGLIPTKLHTRGVSGSSSSSSSLLSSISSVTSALASAMSSLRGLQSVTLLTKGCYIDGEGHKKHKHLSFTNCQADSHDTFRCFYLSVCVFFEEVQLTCRSCSVPHLWSTFLSRAFRRKSLNSGDLSGINKTESVCWS